MRQKRGNVRRPACGVRAFRISLAGRGGRGEAPPDGFGSVPRSKMAPAIVRDRPDIRHDGL